MTDLLVLLPDNQWQAVIEELLPRHQSLEVRKISFRVERGLLDGGLRTTCVQTAKLLQDGHRHVLVVFDWQGCGATRSAANEAAELEQQLAADWSDRAAVIIVEPELEAWLIGAHRQFANLPSRPRCLDVRAWMSQTGLWPNEDAKPEDPKAAVEGYLRAHRLKRSAYNYRLVARSASLRLDRCQCESFQRFVGVLRRWFPPQAASGS